VIFAQRIKARRDDYDTEVTLLGIIVDTALSVFELDDSPDSTGTVSSVLRQIVGTGGRGIATITTANDQVFVDGFDSESTFMK